MELLINGRNYKQRLVNWLYATPPMTVRGVDSEQFSGIEFVFKDGHLLIFDKTNTEANNGILSIADENLPDFIQELLDIAICNVQDAKIVERLQKVNGNHL